MGGRSRDSGREGERERRKEGSAQPLNARQPLRHSQQQLRKNREAWGESCGEDGGTEKKKLSNKILS